MNYNVVNIEREIFEIKNSAKSNIEFYNKAISICQNKLSSLKKQLINDKFESEQLEIHFFKTIKQKPLSNLIYYSEIKSFELQFPKGNKKEQKLYISNKQNKLNRFFSFNMDFVQYIELDLDYLDEQYFTRKCFNMMSITHSKFYYLEPEFNTSHDMLLGKLTAFKMFNDFLKKRLLELEHNAPNSMKSNLQWTSSKVALTELVYALYHSGAINKGNVDIKEIATALQNTFNFELGDYYRTYTEIRSRKKSKAKFMDELSNSLSTKLNADDELK